jgi:hypothetical protein
MLCGVCSSDQLCDDCLETSFARLTGVMDCRAATWVSQLAARRRRPWMPWPLDSERVRIAANPWVEDLTRDIRLRARLVDELLRWAARRWAAIAGCPLAGTRL